MNIRNLDHSRLFDVHRWSDHPEVNNFVDLLYEAHIRSLEPTDRKPTQDKNPYRKALKTLLIDLYVGWVDDSLLVTAFSRSNSTYRQGRYNELHISPKVKDVVDQLVDAGYLLEKPGFKDRRKGGSGRVSRIWPTTRLEDLFRDARFGVADVVISAPDRERVILKKGKDEDPKKGLIDYRDTDQTRAMRDQLVRYQALLDRHHIDVCSLEEPVIKQGNGLLRIGREHVFICRIFNDGSFDRGGRYFGGWWQIIPKKLRRDICIDGQFIVEKDFSSLFPRMIYCLEGITPPDDPYGIDLSGLAYADMPPKDGRGLIKKMLNTMFNKRPGQSILRIVGDEHRAAGVPTDDIRAAIHRVEELNHPIRDWFDSGAGTYLMNLESRITEILIDKAIEEDEVILTVHDSYLVRNDKEQWLEKLLRDACQQVLGGEMKLKTENEIGDSLFRHQWRTGQISGAADISAISNSHYNLMMEVQRERPIPEWKAGYRKRWRAFKEEGIERKKVRKKVELGGGLGG